MFTKILSSSAIVAAGLLYAAQAYAGPPSLYGDTVSARPDGFVSNTTLTVSGPNGFTASEFAKSGSPSLSISDNSQMADGLYTWTTTSMTSEKVKNHKAGLNNGRGDAEKAYVNKSVSESGSFRVIGGVIVSNDNSQSESQMERIAETSGLFGK